VRMGAYSSFDGYEVTCEREIITSEVAPSFDRYISNATVRKVVPNSKKQKRTPANLSRVPHVALMHCRVQPM
jgi:hypothetical protein